MDYSDLLKDMRGLSIWPNIDDELRDIFDAIVELYLQWDGAIDNSQHRLVLRSLCLKSMQNTSRIYQQNMPFTTDRTNFSDLLTQWSYMFVFMLRHIYLVFVSLDHVVRERILEVNPSVRPPSICMIGGGPGSDILGIEIVLMKHGFTTPFTPRKVHVLDKCTEWSQSWLQLHQYLPERYRKGIPDVQYHQFNYLENKLTREQLSCIEDADIVTMVKSLSPVAAWLQSKEKKYEFNMENQLLRELKLLSVVSIEDELADIFESVLKIYRQWEQHYRQEQFYDWPTVLRQQCKTRMEDMRIVYQKYLRFTINRIDFDDVYTRWAYMFVYMLRHIHLVFTAFDLAVQRRLIKVKSTHRSVSICMIGGGPGSDISGYVLFMMKRGTGCLKVADKVDVLDKCPQWSGSWDALYKFLPVRYHRLIPTAKYRPFDYLQDQLSPLNRSIIKSADVVTMVKSLSPPAAWLRNKQKKYQYIYGDDGRLKPLISEWHSVYEILKAMKPGSLLLYIDNATGPQRNILMDAAKYFNFDVTFNQILQDVRMPTSVFFEARRFIKEMNYNPCTMAGTNEVILLYKES
ncbi:hypothetical protein HOLleu_25853 [Holothuria leucospilota]|uniref:Uncharacterized protein n=1 Tax=Holothuria leucospilota TaxID=206669 RepID=A0A9Q1BTG3_HOLLE|nr:hypothetical protein HOLleu_25853 [Holothuria leucospilota]